MLCSFMYALLMFTWTALTTFIAHLKNFFLYTLSLPLPAVSAGMAHIYTIICLKSVVVRKLQVAILSRSPREMSQTDRIVWKHILSRVHVSVRPRICFIREKTPNLSLIQSRPHVTVVYFNGSPTGHCLASVESGVPNPDGLIGRTDTATVLGEGGVFASVHVRACMRDVFAICDNDILPRLIMIIIKIIILYFIQIRHTDDFSWTGNFTHLIAYTAFASRAQLESQSLGFNSFHLSDGLLTSVVH